MDPQIKIYIVDDDDDDTRNGETSILQEETSHPTITHETSTLDFSLAHQDNFLRNIESQIEYKRAMLLNKQKILREASKENEFLTKVTENYQKYYDYILKQKRDQIKAMNLLQGYIEDLMANGKLGDKDIQEARKDQKSLTHEMSGIQRDLDAVLK